MDILVVFIIFSFCFAAMAIGLIIKKRSLQKGCSLSPEDCACHQEGKDPSKCDKDSPTQNTHSL